MMIVLTLFLLTLLSLQSLALRKQVSPLTLQPPAAIRPALSRLTLRPGCLPSQDDILRHQSAMQNLRGQHCEIAPAPKARGARSDASAASAMNGIGYQTGENRSTSDAASPKPDSEMLAKLGAARSKFQETFGKLVIAMMAAPQYRHCAIADLAQLAFEPLSRDRVAIALPAQTEAASAGVVAGIAIWASVSADVDAKIREQIKAGVYPVRLSADDWASGEIKWLLDVVAPTPQLAAAMVASGEINWLLDVIAPTHKLAQAVTANIRHVIPGSQLSVLPILKNAFVGAKTTQETGGSF